MQLFDDEERGNAAGLMGSRRWNCVMDMFSKSTTKIWLKGASRTQTSVRDEKWCKTEVWFQIRPIAVGRPFGRRMYLMLIFSWCDGKLSRNFVSLCALSSEFWIRTDCGLRAARNARCMWTAQHDKYAQNECECVTILRYIYTQKSLLMWKAQANRTHASSYTMKTFCAKSSFLEIYKYNSTFTAYTQPIDHNIIYAPKHIQISTNTYK